mgnify:CR=1 FL=1
MQDPIKKFEEDQLLSEGLFGRLRNSLTNMGNSVNQSINQKQTKLQKTLQDPAHKQFIDKYSAPLVFQVLDTATNKPQKQVLTAQEIRDAIQSRSLSIDSLVRPYGSKQRMPWKPVKEWNPFKKEIEANAKNHPEPEDKIYYIKHKGVTEKLNGYDLAMALKMGKFDKNQLQIWYPELKSATDKPQYVYFVQDHPDRDMLLNFAATI